MMQFKKMFGILVSVLLTQSALYADMEFKHSLHKQNNNQSSKLNKKRIKLINSNNISKLSATQNTGQKSSNAHQSSSSLGVKVNDQTGELDLNLPIINLPGIVKDIGLDLSISYQQQKTQDTKSNYGLPPGWNYNISYIKSRQEEPDGFGRIFVDGGKSYIIDGQWVTLDEKGARYYSGMKYYNLKNMQFSHKDGEVTISNKTYDYSYLLSFSNGIKEYFDNYGKLILKVDRFGNYIAYHYTNYQYPTLSVGSPEQVYLSSIEDSNHQVLTVKKDGDSLKYTLPDKSEIDLSVSNDEVSSITDQIGAKTSINYSAENPGFISRISWPNGLSQNIFYDGIIKEPVPASDHTVKVVNLPAVSEIDSKSYDSDTLSKIYYSYDSSGNNYLGYQAHDQLHDQLPVTIENTVDSLLQSDDNNYFYSVTINNELTSTTKTYNHLHLLTSTETRETKSGHKISSVSYRYPGESANGDFQTYTKLNENYQTPSEVMTTEYNPPDSEGNFSSRTKLVKTKFDDYGRPVEIKTYEKVSNDDPSNLDSNSFELVKMIKSQFDEGNTESYDHYGLPLGKVNYDFKPDGVYGRSPKVTYEINTLSSDHKEIQNSMLLSGGSDIVNEPHSTDWLRVVDDTGKKSSDNNNEIYKLSLGDLDIDDYSHQELIVGKSNDRPTVLKVAHGWLYYGTEDGNFYRASYHSAKGANKSTKFHTFNGKIVDIEFASDHSNFIVSYIDKDSHQLRESGKISWRSPSLSENIADAPPSLETDGKLVSYKYDSNGRITDKKLAYATGAKADSPETSYTYGKYGSSSQYQEQCDADALGYTNCQVIDLATGDITKKIVREQNSNDDTGALITSFDYDKLGRLIAKITPMGYETDYAYYNYQNDKSNYETETSPDGYKTYKKFNSFGKVIEEGDYDADGKQVPKVSYEYDQWQRPTSKIDIQLNNLITSYEYDSQNRLTKITTPEKDEISYAYDVVKQTKTELYNKNKVKVSYYNDAGDETGSTAYSVDSSSNGSGQTIVTYAKYNGNNQVALVQSGNWSDKNGLATKVTTEYNAEGQPREHKIYSENKHISGVSNVYRDLLGNVLFKHIVMHNTDNTVNPKPQLPSWCSNESDGYCTDYSDFNAAGQLIYDCIPDNTSIACGENYPKKYSFTYDEYGRLQTKTDPNGTVTKYTYDDDSHKKDVTLTNSNSNDDIQYSYVHYPKGGSSAGLLELVSKTENGLTDTLSYKYNYQGKKTAITYPDNKKETWKYDTDKDQLTSYTDAFNNTTNYNYDSYGRISSYDYIDNQDNDQSKNGHTVSIDYYPHSDDSINSGQIEDVNYDNGVTTKYSYNGLGQMGEEETINSDKNDIIKMDYTYDDLQNLVGINYSSDTNTSKNENHLEVNHYNSLHQLVCTELKASDAANDAKDYQAITYQYDQRGNIISKSIKTGSDAKC